MAKETGLTKTAAGAAIESPIDGITKALKKGDSITFVGFGTFKTSQRKARTARNPQTGAPIKIPRRGASSGSPPARRSRKRSSNSPVRSRPRRPPLARSASPKRSTTPCRSSRSVDGLFPAAILSVRLRLEEAALGA